MAKNPKCEFLRDLRRQFAQANDIPYETQECTFEGECPGTCPRCDAEVEYLEEMLQERIGLGLPVQMGDVTVPLYHEMMHHRLESTEIVMGQVDYRSCFVSNCPLADMGLSADVFEKMKAVGFKGAEDIARCTENEVGMFLQGDSKALAEVKEKLDQAGFSFSISKKDMILPLSGLVIDEDMEKIRQRRVSRRLSKELREELEHLKDQLESLGYIDEE